MRIVFDLDGTLIDMRERWYRLHVDYAKEYGLEILPRDAYITKKQNGVDERTILEGADSKRLNAYIAARMRSMESSVYLQHDALWDGVHELLGSLAPQHDPILITGRTHEHNFRQQIEQLGIAAYFSSHVLSHGFGRKSSLLRTYSSQELAAVPFVSDSLEDHSVATALGMRPIIVSYGCRSAAYFAKYGVDACATSIEEVGTRIKECL